MPRGWKSFGGEGANRQRAFSNQHPVGMRHHRTAARRTTAAAAYSPFETHSATDKGRPPSLRTSPATNKGPKLLCTATSMQRLPVRGIRPLSNALPWASGGRWWHWSAMTACPTYSIVTPANLQSLCGGASVKFIDEANLMKKKKSST